MNRAHIFNDIEKATVSLPQKGGQGVLVGGNLILTAAHCTDYRESSLHGEGSFIVGDYFIEEISTSKGRLKVAPLAVEPVADIAVLGALDDQEFAEEASDFEAFCERTKPVRLCRSDFPLFEEFKVQIYTHKGIWVTGKAIQCTEDATKLFVEADEQIEGGTSGGPIINDSGELVGVVSNFSEVNVVGAKSNGTAPRPHLTLPVWVCRRI